MSSPTLQDEPHILQPPSYFAFIVVPMQGFLSIPYINLSLTADDEWETPKEFFDDLCEKYSINPRLDPCATSANRKCLLFFTEEENGLRQDWDTMYGVIHPTL